MPRMDQLEAGLLQWITVVASVPPLKRGQTAGDAAANQIDGQQGNEGDGPIGGVPVRKHLPAQKSCHQGRDEDQGNLGNRSARPDESIQKR